MLLKANTSEFLAPLIEGYGNFMGDFWGIFYYVPYSVET